jgi:hypothetical protein
MAAIAITAPASAQSGEAENAVAQGRAVVEEIQDQRRQASKKDEQDYVKDVLGAPVINSPYLQGVYDKLAALAEAGKPSLVIKDTNWAQAYVAGGTTIGATVGLLNGMSNEAQFACLLAHELGHVAMKHSERAGEEASANNEKSKAARSIVGVIGRKVGAPSVVTREAEKIAEDAVTKSYKKEFENEADAYGLNLLVEAGYDPYECANAFHLMDYFFRLQGSEIFGDPKNYDTLTDRAKALRAAAEAVAPLDNEGEARSAAFVAGRDAILSLSTSEASVGASTDQLQPGKFKIPVPMKTPDMPPCEQDVLDKLQQNDADTRFIRDVMVAGYVTAGFDSGMVQDIPLDQMVKSFGAVDKIAHCQANKIIEEQVPSCMSMYAGPNRPFWQKAVLDLAKRCSD